MHKELVSCLVKLVQAKVWLGELRPKLKFYLFPLTRPTLKKGPTQKINYFNF